MTTTRNDLQAIARRAMMERGLVPDFSDAELAECRAVPRELGALDSSVRDLRALSWCSIDNDDSRDLDQLTVAEAMGGGTTKVLVAIADVDAKVQRGSALDRHAAKNTTSVYTDSRVFPMLPELLSTDITSLNEGEERRAVVTEMSIDSTGEVSSSAIYAAVVANRAKLAYNAVAAWLEDGAAAPAKVTTVAGLAENLRLQDSAAQLLKARRHERGALGLETREPRAVFRDDHVSDLRLEQKNRAKELIEDFMIAANITVAQFLDSKRSPSLRRVLRSPERWGRIVELAAVHGTRLSPQPDARALDAFLNSNRRSDPAHFPDLSLAVVKLLGRGEYAVEMPGQRAAEHFGLAVKDYTHSTAPNRRYPDLLTQRLVKAALAARPAPYTVDELTELAGHCNLQEAAAAKVERQVRKSAAAMLLEDRIGEIFEAIVTGASAKGTWVRLLRPPVEGRLIDGFAGLDVGDSVTVRLSHTDVQRGFIDFSRRR